MLFYRMQLQCSNIIARAQIREAAGMRVPNTLRSEVTSGNICLQYLQCW